MLRSPFSALLKDDEGVNLSLFGTSSLSALFICLAVTSASELPQLASVPA